MANRAAKPPASAKRKATGGKPAARKKRAPTRKDDPSAAGPPEAEATSGPAAAKRKSPGRKTARKTTAKAKPAASKAKTPKTERPKTEAAAKPAPVNPPPSQILGQIVWLAMHSPAHRHLFLTDLEWLVLPPLLLKQFRVFRKNGKPFAYVSWAMVSEEVEQRLKSGNIKLRPGDWKCGEMPLIVDVLAPFGGGEEVKRMINSTFSNRS